MKDRTEAARAAETPTFESLFLEQWPRIHRLLCGLVGDPVEAEDLALEAFVRLHRRSPHPEPGFNAGGWLHRVATNLGLQSIRSERRRVRYEQEAGKWALEQAPETRPAELFAQKEERRMARQVLGGMKEGQAQLLVLRHSGLSYKEISEALGLSPTSIGPLLLRAEREFERRYRLLAKEEA